jgi:hypothetical protein
MTTGVRSRFGLFLFLGLGAALLAACGESTDPPADSDAAIGGDPDAPLGTPDGPSNTPDTGVPAADAGPGSPMFINCGTGKCARTTDVCCFTGYPNITTTCTKIGMCTNLSASCDGPEDCQNGDVCCGDQSGAVCKPASGCTAFPSSQLCHDNSDCPTSKNCHMSMFVPWPIC